MLGTTLVDEWPMEAAELNRLKRRLGSKVNAEAARQGESGVLLWTGGTPPPFL
jgi:hypothetical protein